MKQTLFISAVTLACATCIACAIHKSDPTDPVKINGIVRYLGVPYEGANHLESLPVAGEKFYVREFRLDKNFIGPILDSFVSDSVGRFSIYLAPAHYSVISESSAAKIGLTRNFNSAECDSACFRQQLLAGEATFQVDAGSNVELRILVDEPGH